MISAPLALSLVLSLQNQATYTKSLEALTVSDAGRLHLKLHDLGIAQASGVLAHKISYFSPRTRNPEGQSQRLTGALFLPSKGSIKGLVVYYHGTIAVRNGAPSRAPEGAYSIAVTFISQGFAVAMPDYLGLGDSEEIHPFPLGKINSWSGIDMISPARQTAASLGRPIGKPLFMCGFSEGGAAAMWGARHIQDDPEPHETVTASAPISGPYDLTGVTAQSMVSDQSNPLWRVGRSYLSGYMAYSAKRWAGVEAEDLFVPSMATYIHHVFSTAASDWQVMERLAKKALQLRPLALSIRPIIEPAFAEALKKEDKTHPLIKLLAESNCFDWLPDSPMRLIALERDFVVSADNSRKALACMRARGADPKKVDMLILTDGADHIKSEIPAVYEAAQYFSEVLNRQADPS